MIDYVLIRSRRKTMAIHIQDGHVKVRAPLRIPKREIDMFVLSKDAWISESLAKLAMRARQQENFVVEYGSLITFRGKDYPIVSRSSKMAGFDGAHFYIPPGLTHGQIKVTCVQIYRRLALIHFTNRVGYFAGIMGVAPSAIKINGAKTRWGSCSSKKSINFSWRLVLANDDVIDYVIVHEMAHLTEMNHSSRFWAIVAGVLPGYSIQKAKLKALHERLARESWD